MTASLAASLASIRAALVEETSALPGTQKMFGRPHAHPRTRYEPRYSRTGERLPGSVRVRPDCPRPVRGRCECPPDGSWRPSVGVVRADSTAHHAVGVPAERLPGWDADIVWVDAVYEQAPDGLWHCRRPMRRALEALRGVSLRRWSIAVRLLRGDALASVWGAHGAPPEPFREALRILGTLERWAQVEREADWEHRPRQWWDPPRKPNARPLPKSDAQENAERFAQEVIDDATAASTGAAGTSRGHDVSDNRQSGWRVSPEDRATRIALRGEASLAGA